MFVNANDAHAGQSVGAGGSDQLGDRPYRDGADGMPGQASAAAIAETVVRSIINRRNTYRAHRRVVDDRGRPAFLDPIEHRTTTLRCGTAVASSGLPAAMAVDTPPVGIGLADVDLHLR
jgi:hypothetical protein